MAVMVGAIVGTVGMTVRGAVGTGTFTDTR